MDLSNFSEVHEYYEVAEPGSSEHRDRLSELPDSLILVILSLLPMRDVAATTLLSKRWKHIWTTVPCLHFNTLAVDLRYPIFDTFYRFQYFVCGAIARWNGSKIVKFSLSCMFNDYYLSSYILDCWLLFAIEKQIEELYINLNYPMVLYYVPSRIYVCPSIKKLSLVCCELKIVGSVQWDQLVSLRVENAVNKLLSGAPLLEVLNLCVKQCSENLNIQSNRLKVVRIDRFSYDLSGFEYDAMLRICAPNLESLEISGLPYTRCLLNVPSSTHVVVGFHHPRGVDREEEEEDVFSQIF